MSGTPKEAPNERIDRDDGGTRARARRTAPEPRDAVLQRQLPPGQHLRPGRLRQHRPVRARERLRPQRQLRQHPQPRVRQHPVALNQRCSPVMCEYRRVGRGAGPSGSAGRPTSLSAASDPSSAASDPSQSVTPSSSAAPEAPRLALGVELLGEFKNSGYSPPPFLVRRPDGQVIQMSRLLYLVATLIDGTRGAAAIAELASADLGRSLGADQVRYVVAAKLLPLGLIAGPGAPAAPPTASPLLALRARGTLLPEKAANVVAALLRPLFRWPAVLAVVVSVAAVDWWLLATHQLAVGLDPLLRDPATLLIVFVLSVASAAFHECGHATACRYGGAPPGQLGG